MDSAFNFSSMEEELLREFRGLNSEKEIDESSLIDEQIQGSLLKLNHIISPVLRRPIQNLAFLNRSELEFKKEFLFLINAFY